MPCYQFYGYMGNIGIPFLTPSVRLRRHHSFSFVLRGDWSWGRAGGAGIFQSKWGSWLPKRDGLLMNMTKLGGQVLNLDYPDFGPKVVLIKKKVVDLPLCNSKLFLKLIVALWKLCIIHIHILCIYIYTFIYLFIYLHTVLLNDKCMYTYFSFTSPTWDHESVRKWLVSTKHHIMSRRRVSNARCLGETLAILHHQYQDFRSVLREFYLLICLSLIAIDFWTAAISI